MMKLQMTAGQSPALNECIKRFERRCVASNLSEFTQATYKVHCDCFTAFVGCEDVPMCDLPKNITEEFVAYLKQEHKRSDTTILSYMRTVRAFLYYCMEMEYMPAYKIKMPKTTAKIKETYTDAELAVLLKKPSIKQCGFTEYKVWVFSNYLFATGNRLATALDLRICDLDFDNGLIQMNTTKNRKAQIIPMSNVLKTILKEYLAYRNGEPEDYVFCDAYGNQGKRRGYQDAVAKYNQTRGIAKTSIHLYRHTFAKKWIMNGGDVFRLQKLLGHSDLTITREYVNMFGTDLSENYRYYNPLDVMNTQGNSSKIQMGA